MLGAWCRDPYSVIQSRTGGFSGEATAMSDVTRILSQIGSGDPSATEGLLPLVYE
jgi:hypothetical protein